MKNSLHKDYINRCSDCPCLVEKDEKWFCDEADKPCSKVEKCPEGLERCTCCETYFTDTKLHKETNFGLLCDRCLSVIQSRGEKLTNNI